MSTDRGRFIRRHPYERIERIVPKNRPKPSLYSEGGIDGSTTQGSLLSSPAGTEAPSPTTSSTLAQHNVGVHWPNRLANRTGSEQLRGRLTTLRSWEKRESWSSYLMAP